MRIVVRHGHFAFYSGFEGDIFRFCDYFSTNLVRENDYYTFPNLQGLPRYSIKGKKYGNFTASKNFEGPAPWDVMKANGIVYDVAGAALVPKANFAVRADPKLVEGFYLSATSILQPGALTKAGRRIVSYDGFLIEGLWQLRLNGFGYE